MTEQINTKNYSPLLSGCIDVLTIMVAYKLIPEVIFSMSNFGFIGKAFIWSPRFSFSQFIFSWFLIAIFVSAVTHIRQYLFQNELETSKALLVTSLLVSIPQIIVWFLLSFVAIDVFVWYQIFSEGLLPWEIKVPVIYIVVFIATEILRQKAKWRTIRITEAIQKSRKSLFVFLLFLSSYLATTILFGVQMFAVMFLSGTMFIYLENLPDWISIGLTFCSSAILLIFTETILDKLSTSFSNFLLRLLTGRHKN